MMLFSRADYFELLDAFSCGHVCVCVYSIVCMHVHDCMPSSVYIQMFS